MQLNVFFPTNAVYSLKSFISATSNVNFYFFLPLLGFGEEDPRGVACSWFIPEIPEQTSDWEWHKTSRSRVHHVKIHLIILHVHTFWRVSPRNAWSEHWIDRDKWCLLRVRRVIRSLSYFKIYVVILVNFRSDKRSKTAPKYIRQPYACARSDRRTEEIPSIRQFT